MKKTFTLLAIIFNLSNTCALAAQPPSNFVVFGDSLSDIGNNYWVYATGTPITSFDQQGNKSTWVNYLSETILKQPASFSSKPALSPLSQTVSYAYAGADTSDHYLNSDWPENTPIPDINPDCKKPGLMKDAQQEVSAACVPGMLKQIDLYLNDVNHKPNPNTLFFIWAGANDLFYKLPTGQPPEQIIKTAMTNLVQAKNKLLDEGVLPQQIYVLNLPDLSKTPFAIKNNLNLTQISVAFNTNLSAVLTTADQHHPGIPTSHIISMYDLLNDVVLQPDKYHVKNTTESCAENKKAPLCSEYVFYDNKHPTALMHHVISDYISASLKS